jgi:hypothetical protein
MKPATAIRIPANGDGGRGSEGAQYPLNGAQIDYFLATDASDPITLTILDKSGKPIRTFTSVPPPARPNRGEDGGGEDEEGRFRVQYPTTLDKKAGLHRFTWDLRYAGPLAFPAQQPAGQPGPNGPVAAPGLYTVEISSGSWTSKQPLEIKEDPRVTADGVSTADLEAQLAHNLRVLALVSDTNHLVARIRAAQTRMKAEHTDSSDQATQLKAVADKLITPTIRYSQPALQTHVTYLYSENTRTDQRPGRDAIERYEFLRKQIDALTAETNRILGPA